MNRKYTTILRIGAIAALMLIVVAVGLGFHNKSMAAYSAKLTEGDRMLAEEDYSNAVLKYQEAIEDKPKEEQGYLKLCVAYELSGHEDYALQAIENGLVLIPNSESLLAKKKDLTGVPEVKTALARSMDIDILTALSVKTYNDYGVRGEVEKVSPYREGAIKVRVKGVNADLIYRNTSEQPDAVSGNAPNSDSIPDEVFFDDILAVLGGGEQLTADDIATLGVSNLKVVNHPEYGSAVTFNYDLYVFTIESDAEGNVTEGASNSVSIPAPSPKSGADKEVQGVVINALNGSGVKNVNLVFRKGGDSFETRTDGSGHFQIQLESGEYEVDCSADGFIDETKTIFVPSNTSEWSCEFVMSPSIETGEARFVLTWGSSPSDLDSHLIGSGVHTSFENKNSGSASLDLDDVDGYGPETTTLSDMNGNYTFVVHDYTESGNLGNSGAQVVVYLPGQDPVTITISGSGSADTWVVCEIDNGHLNIINSIEEYGLY